MKKFRFEIFICLMFLAYFRYEVYQIVYSFYLARQRL